MRKDYGNTLSLGEQQRLGFARLLLNPPELVLLDEATSALDEANEELMYELVRTMNISVVSVGHRPTLNKFHDVKLTLGSDGGSAPALRTIT